MLLLSAVILSATPASAQSGRAMPGIDCNFYGPRHFCEPYLLYPPGQDLRLTIQIPVPEEHQAESGASDSGSPEEIDSIRTLFAALRRCWVAPPEDKVRPGMQITVRFSLNRNGTIIGQPRLTYTTKGVSAEQKDAYYRMIIDGLSRCTPFRFSKGMGGAIAGRPLVIRYIETRGTRKAGG
jgi:hypothetical protein